MLVLLDAVFTEIICFWIDIVGHLPRGIAEITAFTYNLSVWVYSFKVRMYRWTFQLGVEELTVDIVSLSRVKSLIM